MMQANESTNGDLWIQALTYFRDQPGSEPQLKMALDEIRKKNILSPLLVLEILKENSRLKFGVLREFLLQNLKTQQDQIKRSTKKLNEDQNNINNFKNEIAKMKRTARNFDQKVCAYCQKELSLPTVHFMCGHTYHEFCVETEGIRRCTICVESKFVQHSTNSIYHRVLTAYRTERGLCCAEIRHRTFLQEFEVIEE